MKVLITGANGFVGHAIVSELSGGTYDLTLLDRPGSTAQTLNHGAARFYGLDLANPDDVLPLKLGPIDTVIHAAGLAHQFGTVTKEAFWKVNVQGTINIAHLAVRSRARHFILISSVSVYGGAENGIFSRDETSACKPEGFYAESKLQSETVSKIICEENGLPLTILRLATVIGEGDRGNVFKLIKAIDKRRFLWIGKGENFKSLVYKRDVARSCVSVMAAEHSGTRIYNVSAPPSTMKDIVSNIGAALNKKPFGLSVPPQLLRTGFRLNAATFGINKLRRVNQTVEKWLADDSYSAARIEKECGFRPEITVEQAIAREVNWYLKNK